MNTTLQAKLDALVSDGLTYKAVFVPQSASRNSAEKQPSLNWRVTLHRSGTPGGIIATDYMQGIGHVPKPASFCVPGDARLWERDERNKSANSGQYIAGSYIFDSFFNARKPLPAPALADVLSCLLLDGVAADCSFEDWCSDFGYDPDSRKAEATYNRCRDIGHQLQRMFTRAELAELRELFQDY